MSKRSKNGGRRPPAAPARDGEKPARPKWTNVLFRWLAGIVVAGLAAALTALVTDWVGALGKKATDAVLPKPSASAPADPITVAVQPLGMCGENWVAPRAASEFASLTPTDLDKTKGWPDWPPAAGGSHAAPHNVLFFVQGRSGAEVVLTGLKVRVVERKPLPATSTVLIAGCGGDGAFRWLDVDLDESPPRPTPGFRANAVEGLRGEVPDKQLTPIRFPYSVSLSDAEPFLVTARTRRCDCAWVAELTWASEGRTGTTVIDDRGRPFRSTATTNASAECHIDTAGVACR